MIIDRKDVEYVANLARLELTEAEKEEQLQKLNKILDYMEILGKVDTQDVAPLAHVLPVHNVLRKDEPHQTLEKDKTLQNAPEESQGMFRVPKIV